MSFIIIINYISRATDLKHHPTAFRNLYQFVFQSSLSGFRVHGLKTFFAPAPHHVPHCYFSLIIIWATSVTLVCLRISSFMIRSHKETPCVALSIARWTFSMTTKFCTVSHSNEWVGSVIPRHCPRLQL